MKYFKGDAKRTSPKYEITIENFDKVTKRKSPFIQKSDKGTSMYGICPSCLNPIQIIGLTRKIKVTPYGKHTGEDIDGLRSWNQIKYEYCPYAAKKVRREINENELFSEITEDVIELYDLLKNNFDRVVYVISKGFGIRCSPNFWRKSLQQYLANEAYCYPWLTDANLPYVFALMGMQHQNIYGQKILEGSDLFYALQKHPNVKFADISDDDKYKVLLNKKGFLNLFVRFYGHKQKAVSGETLKESIMFCVDDFQTNETLFEKCIEFDENYFINILSTDISKNRQQWLLDIAEEYMPPLELS